MITKVKPLFTNQQNKLRSGWWIAIFIAIVAATRIVYKPIKEGLTAVGAGPLILELLPLALILFVTFTCLWLKREPLTSVGLVVNRRWFMHLGAGILAAGIMVTLLCGLIYLAGGVSFNANQDFQLKLITIAAYTFFIGAAMEELLHRGFIFQRLIDGIGIWPAQLLVASLFAVGHWSNPEMSGNALIFGSLDLFVGSLVLGLAYYKTRSLALPIGLHFGWNFVLGSVFGFSVSGYEKQGLLTPNLLEAPDWINGAGFGPEASVLSVMVGLLGLALLIVWDLNKAPDEPVQG